MTDTVSFPNLGLVFELSKEAFNIFGVSIKWYAVLITFGYLLAIVYVILKSRNFGLDFDKVLDIIIFGTIGGILGARLYFVAFKWDYYSAHLDELFSIREGGMAIYGGLIGAIIVGYIVAKIRKVRFIPLLDMSVIGFLIGQGIGRWGNFVNQEAYGSITSPDYLFGMTGSLISKEVALETGNAVSESILVHPCFLYESVWCILGAILLIFYIKHRKFDGEIGLLYCVWYGLERTIVEGLRTDSLYIGSSGVRVSQLLSFLLVIAALIILCINYYKIYKNRVKLNNPEYKMLYANTEDAINMFKQIDEEKLAAKSKKSKNKAIEIDEASSEINKTQDS